jgi:glycosyltransferase involved in cell wall biosynthesis
VIGFFDYSFVNKFFNLNDEPLREHQHSVDNILLFLEKKDVQKGGKGMRVALFTDTFPPQINGVSLTLRRLTQHLLKRGIDCLVFAPDFPQQEEPFDESIVRLRSFPLIFYPECRVAVPGYDEIEQSLRSFSPDLIHIATPFTMGWCGRRYGLKHRIPMVASHHTHFDKYLAYYRLSFLSPWIWQYLRRFHEPCRRVFVPSVEAKQALEQHGFSRVALWKRGVDTRLFNPRKENLHFKEKYGITERYLLLYVGRMAPEKEVDVLFRVMDRLPSPLREQTHWMFVGDGPMLAEWKKKQTTRVTFTGYLKGEELAEAYASADGFVFPSRTETFGNVVLEALASGTPAIVAGEGGVKEIVRHGETGWVCTPGSPEAFVEAVVELLTHPQQWEDMSFRVREYAGTQSWDAILDGLIEQYKQVVRSKAVPSSYPAERRVAP